MTDMDAFKLLQGQVAENNNKLDKVIAAMGEFTDIAKLLLKQLGAQTTVEPSSAHTLNPRKRKRKHQEPFSRPDEDTFTTYDNTSYTQNETFTPNDNSSSDPIEGLNCLIISPIMNVDDEDDGEKEEFYGYDKEETTKSGSNLTNVFKSTQTDVFEKSGCSDAPTTNSNETVNGIAIRITRKNRRKIQKKKTKKNGFCTKIKWTVNGDPCQFLIKRNQSEEPDGGFRIEKKITSKSDILKCLDSYL